MPQHVIKFNVPEEREELALHMMAPAMLSVLCDFDNWLRRERKTGPGDGPAEWQEGWSHAIEHVHEQIHHLLEYEGLDIWGTEFRPARRAEKAASVKDTLVGCAVGLVAALTIIGLIELLDKLL